MGNPPAERKGGVGRTTIMDKNKQIDSLLARVILLEESQKGLEELIIHLLNEKAAARNPMIWRKPEMAKA